MQQWVVERIKMGAIHYLCPLNLYADPTEILEEPDLLESHFSGHPRKLLIIWANPPPFFLKREKEGEHGWEEQRRRERIMWTPF